jgi:hypothetical protein
MLAINTREGKRKIKVAKGPSLKLEFDKINGIFISIQRTSFF